MLYPNFAQSFSTNHIEGGQHILNAKLRAEKLAMYQVDLLPIADVQVVKSEASKAYYEDEWIPSITRFQGSVF